MESKKEFRTIRNVISEVLGRRISNEEGAYDAMFEYMNVRGMIQGKEFNLILAIIKYLDRMEKESMKAV